MNGHPTKRRFRFGVYITTSGSRNSFIQTCRRAEAMGYDVVCVGDHLGMLAPFPALVLAAEATVRPRLATAVLNANFYNSALLATDVAWVDQLTGGRLELGLGTGYMKAEFEAAGLSWPTPGQRVDHLERTVTELRRLLEEQAYGPVPAQKGGPPLWLAGRGDRLLRAAAREADIIGFSGLAAGKDGGKGDLADVNGVDERVGYVRALLGDRIRHVEFNILIWRVITTNDRRAEAERLGRVRSLGPAALLSAPTVLIGTARQIADQLIENRQRWGFSYITVGDYYLDTFSSVIEIVRSNDG